MKNLNDAEYCTGVVEAVVDAASRYIYTCALEGRARPRLHVVRTHHDYTTRIYVDPKKESLVLVLEGLRHSIQLLYKRRDRRFTLKRCGIVSMETMALNNERLDLPLGVLVGIGAEVVPAFKGHLADIYNSCMRSLNDVEYCAGVVEAVVDAASRWIYTSVPEGRARPRFHIIRSHGEYGIDVYVDRNKEGVIVILDGPGHAIHLFYKRDGGKFVVKSGLISNLGVIAMMNGHFEPPLDALKPHGEGS
jgi:hypothetical protein